MMMICTVLAVPTVPDHDHVAAVTPTPTPLTGSSPRPDMMKLAGSGTPGSKNVKVSSVNFPKSKDVDSAIHTLKTKTGAEPAGATAADNGADLDGANTLIIPVGIGFGGFGYPGFGGGYGGGLGGFGWGR